MDKERDRANDMEERLTRVSGKRREAAVVKDEGWHTPSTAAEGGGDDEE